MHVQKRYPREGRVGSILGAGLMLTGACGGGPQTLFEQTSEQAEADGRILYDYTADQGEVVVRFAPMGPGDSLVARLSGGGQLDALIEDAVFVHTMKLHGDTLYFREQDSGPIETIPLAGGARGDVGDPGRSGCRLAHVLDDALVLDCFDETLALPLSGGAADVIFSGVAQGGMIDGDDLIFIDAVNATGNGYRALKRVSLSGGAAETLWEPTDDLLLTGLAVTAEAFLVLEVEPNPGEDKLARVHRVPRAGGAVTMLGEIAGAESMLGDGTQGFVIVAEAFGSGPNELQVVPVSGAVDNESAVGGPVVAVEAATRQYQINGGFIYWIEDDSTKVSLRRAPL